MLSVYFLCLFVFVQSFLLFRLWFVSIPHFRSVICSVEPFILSCCILGQLIFFSSFFFKILFHLCFVFLFSLFVLSPLLCVLNVYMMFLMFALFKCSSLFDLCFFFCLLNSFVHSVRFHSFVHDLFYYSVLSFTLSFCFLAFFRVFIKSFADHSFSFQ